MKRYGARILDILELPLPLAAGSQNTLTPRPYRCRTRRAGCGSVSTHTLSKKSLLVADLSQFAAWPTNYQSTLRGSLRYWGSLPM